MEEIQNKTEGKSLEWLFESLLQYKESIYKAVGLEEFANKLQDEASAAFIEDDLKKANELKALAKRMKERSLEYRKSYLKAQENRNLIWEELGRIQKLLDKQENGENS